MFATSGAGVLVVALAFNGARLSRTWADPVFWVGLLVIFLPATRRLMVGGVPRAERLAVVLMLGLALYAVKVLLSPDWFTLHDELGHYRSVADLLRTGQLYVPNPLVGAYSYYPGILSVTAALGKLSGLGIFPSGLLVVGFGRLLLMAGLFVLVERVARSSRVAGLAAVLYMANPNFVFFDSQFAYESLALGLGALVLAATARVSRAQVTDWRDLAIAVLLDAALVLSHHLTSYVVAIVITAWAVFAAIRGNSRQTQRLTFLVAFVLVMTGAYAVYAYSATASDIGASITGSLQGLINVVTGAAAGQTPFSSARGYSIAPLEQAIGVLSVVLLLAALPWGLHAIWRRWQRDPGLLILGTAATLYPLSLALRLSTAGNEASNRTSEFIFVGLGTAIALALVSRLRRRTTRRSRLGPVQLRLLGTAYAALVFLGGITVGTAPYDRLPAGYEVSASLRSIDSEGVYAARWAGRRLPANTNFFANVTDSPLLAAYTRLDPQQGVLAGVPVSSVFAAPFLGAQQLEIITGDKLRFLMVDRRDSTALPRSGRYYDLGEPSGGYAQPISPSALAKFDSVRCVNRIFSSGSIVFYDTARLLAGCR